MFLGDGVGMDMEGACAFSLCMRVIPGAELVIEVGCGVGTGGWSHIILLQLPFGMASLDCIFISSHHYGLRIVSVMAGTSGNLPSLKGVVTTDDFSLVVP